MEASARIADDNVDVGFAVDFLLFVSDLSLDLAIVAMEARLALNSNFA